MEYVNKICPICGRGFVVQEKVEKKAIYCTLECLLTDQGREKRGKVSSFVSV